MEGGPASELRPEVEGGKSGWRSAPWSLGCALFGALGLFVNLLVHLRSQASFFSELPALWLSLPFAITTILVGALALVRGERRYRLLAVGLGCAVVTPLLGWFVTAALILVLLALIGAAAGLFG